MHKGELVEAMAVKADITKKDAAVLLAAALAVILATVAAGDKVTLVGFGTFERRERQAREGRKPATGKVMQIPATRLPTFSAGKLFKEKVAPAATAGKATAKVKAKAK